MRRVVEAARQDRLEDADIAELAVVLADSGQRLRSVKLTADLASTGGVASLTTLVCPLMLRCNGLTIPKLGVRGRPAGGVDILETIPGFNARLGVRDAQQALDASGYVHLEAGGPWAPLDGEFFRFRQDNNAQDIPGLVIGSLLAKKIAGGVQHPGLEIRVADQGNFGKGMDEARENAHRFKRVASALSMKSICMMTDATLPQQPFIGRGEALIALDAILDDSADGWLREHLELCSSLADQVAMRAGVTPRRPDCESLRKAHEELLESHGSSWSKYRGHVDLLRQADRIILRAPRDGIVAYDLTRLRTVLLRNQGSINQTQGARPGDQIGVMLRARVGISVEKGAPLMEVRMHNSNAETLGAIHRCVRLESRPRPSVGLPTGTFEVC